MMRIRIIEKARLTLFLLPLLLASFVPPASAAPSYAPGVVPGNQWTFGDWAVSCSILCSQSSTGFLTAIVSLKFVVLNVTGFNVGLNETFTYSSGQSQSSTAIANTQSSNQFFLIAGGLVKGDPISNSTNAPRVNATSARFYAGASRQVNFFYASGPSNGGFQTFAVYWDQITGALLEINQSFTQPGSGTITLQAKVTSTNLWNPTMPDFALSANPLAPASVNVGSSSTSTITLTSQQSLSGPVQVSAIVLPLITNHPVAAVNPATVTLTAGGTGQPGLTITTSPNTVPGIYSVIVNASYTNTIAHFITLDLNVTGPDFSINAIPSYLNVDPGSTASTTLVLRSLMSFAGNVALTVLPTQPNSPQPSLSQSSVLLSAGGSANATLTVSAPNSTPSGPYNLIVNGTSGFLTHNIQLYVYVNQPPPPNINVTASPSIVAIQPGGVGVSSLTITSLHGFTGTVNLSAPSAFVTASLNVNNVTLTPNVRTASAVLTITAPVQAQPGDWSFLVSAIGPGVYSQVRVTARLNPAYPQFTMYAYPTYFHNATLGMVENSKIYFNSFGGYADTLNIFSQTPTTSCEPRITPNVSTVQLPAGGTVYANATISVPYCTTPGDYYPALYATGTQQPLYSQLSMFFHVNGTSTQPDFTLTTTPRHILEVPGGSTGNFTVTVKSINGFSGPVIVIPNSGFSSVLTPSLFSLTPGSSQNVTVSIGVPAFYGGYCCYGLAVLATSGAISHSTGTTLQLNVTRPAPGPAFTVTASQSSMLLQEGHPQSVTVTVASTGFYGPVNLYSEFDPQHFTVQLSQPSVTLTTSSPTATVQMTINNSTSDSVGAWTIMVTGRGGTLLESSQVQLNVTSTTAPDFRITSSPSFLILQAGNTAKVDLTVTSINGFAGNVLLLGAAVANGSLSVSSGGVAKTTLWILPTDNLEPGTNYGYGATGISGTTIRGSSILVDATLRPDFTINDSPTALSFLAGSSGTSMLTLSSIGGFAGTASLVAKSYLAGLTVQLGTSTVAIPANGQGTAGVFVSGSVPGSYVVLVDATSGGVTRSVAIPVTINQVTPFSITANPPSLTIQQGGQSSTKITVKSLNGFSGKVSLNAYAFNFPQLSLSVPSVTLTAGGNATVTMTIPVPSNAGTGLYQVGVSGNTTTFSTSLIVPVTVTIPLNNFSVSANPSLLPMLTGAQGTSTITVNANNGFTGTVTLTNSTAPPGPRCSLSQTIIVLTSTVTSGTSTLTCTGSAPGTYNVAITGTENGEQHSAVVTIFVPRTAYLPGVVVGNSFTISVASVIWKSTIPQQYLPEPSFLKLFNTTSHIDILVTKVSGSNVTFQETWNYNNGTSPSIGYITVNVATGAYNTTGDVPSAPSNAILAKGLQAADHIYEDPNSPTLNNTATRTLLGAARTVNFLNMTNTSPYTTFTSTIEWDQTSGIIAGLNANITINGGPGATARGGFAAALTQTNIWSASAMPAVTIISTTPYPANTGQLITVSFTVSSPSTVTGITVNWGDGTSTDILSVTASSDTHTYATTGTQKYSTFTINVTATNSAGHGSATTTELVYDQIPTVTISNVLPNPANIGQPVTVTFSATDPDGTISSFTVNWGDGKTDTGIAGTATSDSHSYTTSGSFTITVTAADNSGSTGQNAGSVTIQGPLVPTVTITNNTPNPADTGAMVTVTFSVSSTTTVTGITVNWGDGSTTDNLASSTTSDMHTYSSTGSVRSQSFTITVTATNSAGPGFKTAMETVNDRPPTVTISNVSPNPANTGATVTVMFSAMDPDGTIATYSVNWGDGHTDPTISGTATSDLHSYSNAGSFTITVTATDNSGSTGTSSKSMTVNGPGKTTASLSVSCSLNSIASGASTSCTVTVTGSSIYPPVGVVTFSTNSTTGAFTPATGACTLSTAGTCSVTYADTATSSRTALISASYPGDNYNTGATGSFSLKVVKPSTGPTAASLTLACSPSSIQVGSFTTCTVTVSGSSPTGSVTLTTNSPTGYFTPSNGQCTLASGSCAVTYTDTATANTTARIYAHYPGDTYNTGANTNTTMTIVKPSTTTATATTTVTISSGSATADQTATTGVSVQITGSTATNGTPAAINTRDLSSPSTGVGTVSLSGAKFYDVVVTGVTSGNAKVCINYASASSSTTMQYWSGTAWTSATGITVNGGTICGQIPVSALTGTNIAVGNPVQQVPTTPPNNSNLLIIIAGVVAAVVVIALLAAVVLRRRKTIQTPVS